MYSQSCRLCHGRWSQQGDFYYEDDTLILMTYKKKLYHKYNISRGETEVLVVTLRSLKTLMRKSLLKTSTTGKTSACMTASATTFMAIEGELNAAQDLRCGWFAKNKYIFPFFQCSETTGWKTKKVGGTTVKCKFTFEYSESGISSSSVGSEY